MRSEDEENEYVQKVAKDILQWCEELVRKNKLDFKLTDCKEKFILIVGGIVGLACDYLCGRNEIILDESSRRLIVYKISPAIIESVNAKVELEAKADAALQATRDSAPKPVVVKAPKSQMVEKEKEKSKPEHKPEAKKVKAPANDGLASAPAAKKQKFDTTGLKKISSFFTVQSSKPSTSSSSQAQSSTGATNDENRQPKVHASNTIASHSSQQAAQPAKPVQAAPSPAPIRIVLPAPQVPAEPAKAAINTSLFAAVRDIVRGEFENGNDEVTIDALLGQAQGISEAQFMEGLEELQRKNYLMIVDDAVYAI